MPLAGGSSAHGHVDEAINPGVLANIYNTNATPQTTDLGPRQTNTHKKRCAVACLSSVQICFVASVTIIKYGLNQQIQMRLWHIPGIATSAQRSKTSQSN